jgi:carboxymethylenebutenolidase
MTTSKPQTADASFPLLPEAGSGPGLLLLAPRQTPSLIERAAYLASEGYVVQPAALEGDDLAAAAALRTLSTHPALRGKIGAVAMGDACTGAVALAGAGGIAALVLYDGGVDPARLAALPCPVVVHTGVLGLPVAAPRYSATIDPDGVSAYLYRDGKPGFADPDSPSWNPYVAGIAYSRSLGLLRNKLGPHYNLNDLWDRHVECEFEIKDATENMKTMVPEPYVNHVPTMTGGVGHDMLKRFYTYHFIGLSPDDRDGVPISRTIGPDRLIEERVLKFTHTTEMDWMLPGVKPTGKTVEIPLIIVITFRGDKLYNEHIYWDQASVLAQLGLIDPTGLPIAGAEEARKLLDKSLPSNTLMANWPTSEGKPI